MVKMIKNDQSNIIKNGQNDYLCIAPIILFLFLCNNGRIGSIFFGLFRCLKLTGAPNAVDVIFDLGRMLDLTKLIQTRQSTMRMTT